jgi:hypothetical protein
MRFLSNGLCIFSVTILTLVSGCSKTTESSAEKSTGNSGITEVSSGSNGGTAIYKLERNGQITYGDRATIDKLAMTDQKSTDTASTLKGDKSLPNEHYQPLSSGHQLMYAYLALNAVPINYERVAQMLSNEYRIEQDEFKRRDLMIASLKPAIDKSIEKAKQNKYYSIEIGHRLLLQKYDFDSKSFLIKAFATDAYSHYFDDNTNYRLKFSNADLFKKLVVQDENIARKIEALRPSQDELKVRVYIFANDTELGQPYINAEIMRIQVADINGKPLL